MRSRKVEPGAAVIRTLIQSEMTSVPPVTAERSPPLSRMTGALSPVIAASLTEATPSMTSPSDGMMSPASTSTTSPGFSEVPGTCCHSPAGRGQQLGHRLGLRSAQRGGLRLAAPLGHRLGEIGEQHGEPEPEIDLEREPVPAGAGHQIAQEQQCRQRGHDLDREHHRVAHHEARVELAERLADRRHQDCRIGHRRDRHPLAQMRCDFHRGHERAPVRLA